ncbi:polyprotein [tropivirus A1]|uniref:Genome polyprotein n=1 Tax=tropivirus A1 TaxID=2116178 RepID=A0A2P1GN42_9PICO|nr:polyprotein [tropivirus A1]AVM87416.1 polyprotein [tropivirus A1]
MNSKLMKQTSTCNCTSVCTRWTDENNVLHHATLPQRTFAMKKMKNSTLYRVGGVLWTTAKIIRYGPVVTHEIPKEDRAGTWAIDAMRFRERIRRFEIEFETTMRRRTTIEHHLTNKKGVVLNNFRTADHVNKHGYVEYQMLKFANANMDQILTHEKISVSKEETILDEQQINRVASQVQNMSQLTAQEVIPPEIALKTSFDSKQTFAQDIPTLPGPAGERFHQLQTINWTSSHAQGSILVRIQLPGALAEMNTSFGQQAIRHTLLKTDLAVQVQVNSTPFHSGALMGFLIPEGQLLPNTITGKSLLQSWIFPSQLINVGVNNSIMIAVPHVGPNPQAAWRTKDTWTLHVVVMAPLRIGTGGSSTVSVSVLAAPINSKFNGLTFAHPRNAQRMPVYQGNKTKIEPGIGLFNSVQPGQATLISNVGSQTPKPLYMGKPVKSFKEVLEIPTQFSADGSAGAFSMATSSAFATKLMEMIVSPSNFSMSYLGELSMMFSQWTGKIILQLITCHSKMHRGKILIAYTPSALPPRNIAEAQQGTFAIFDFGQHQTFEFTIPFISESPWKSTTRADIYNGTAHTGFLTAWVYAPLTFPAGAASTVDVLTLVKAGSDFSLKGVRMSDYATETPVYNNKASDEKMPAIEKLQLAGTVTTNTTAVPVNLGENQSGDIQIESPEWVLHPTITEDTDELNLENFFSRSRFFRTESLAPLGWPKMIRVSPQWRETGFGTRMDDFLNLFTYVRADVQLTFSVKRVVRRATTGDQSLKLGDDSFLQVFVIPPGGNFYSAKTVQGLSAAQIHENFLASLSQYPHVIQPLQPGGTNFSILVPFLSPHCALTTVYDGNAEVRNDGAVRAGIQDQGHFFDVVLVVSTADNATDALEKTEVNMELSFPNSEFWLPRPFPGITLPWAAGAPVPTPPAITQPTPVAPAALIANTFSKSLDFPEVEAGATYIVKCSRLGYTHWAIRNGETQISLRQINGKAIVGLEECTGKIIQTTSDSAFVQALKLIGQEFVNYNIVNNCTHFIENLTGVSLQNSGTWMLAHTAAATLGAVCATTALIPSYQMFSNTTNSIQEACASVTQFTQKMESNMQSFLNPELEEKIKRVSQNMDFTANSVQQITSKLQEFMEKMTTDKVTQFAESAVQKVIAAILKIIGYMLLIFANPNPVTFAAVIALLVSDTLNNAYATRLIYSRTTTMWSKFSTVFAGMFSLPYEWFAEEEKPETATEATEENVYQGFTDCIKDFNTSVSGAKNFEWVITKCKDFIEWFLEKIGHQKKTTPEGYLAEHHDNIMALYAESLTKADGQQIDIPALEANIATVQEHLSHAMKARNAAYHTLLKQTFTNFQEILRDAKIAMNKTRMEPVVIYLYGSPRCGKTIISTLLAQALCKHFGWDPKRDIYTPPPSSDYFDGYVGQKIHIIDDLGQDADGKDFKDFNQMVSTAHYIPAMAKLNQKGIPYCSEIIIVSSNFKAVEPNSIRCHPAIESRLHFKLNVATNSEFTISGKPGEPLNAALACRANGSSKHPAFKANAPILDGSAVSIFGRLPGSMLKEEIDVYQLLTYVCCERDRKHAMVSLFDDLVYQGPEVQPIVPATLPQDEILAEMLKQRTTLETLAHYVKKTTTFQRIAMTCTILGFLGTALYFLISCRNKPEQQGPYSGLKKKVQQVKAKMPEGKLAKEVKTGPIEYNGYPQIYAKVDKNSFPVFFEYDDETGGRLTALGVYDRWYVVNKHALKDSTRIWIRGVIYNVKDMLQRVLQYKGHETDLVAVWCSESPQVRDIRHLFLSELDETQSWTDGLLLHRADTTGNGKEHPLDALISNINKMKTLRVAGDEHKGIISYSGLFGQGFCGAPIVHSSRKEIVLAIHFAGQLSSNMGFGQIITKEMFASPEFEGIRTKIGEAEKPVHVPTKTSLEKSPAYGAYVVEKAPAVLKDSDYRTDVKMSDVLFAKYKADVKTPWTNLETSRDVLLARIKSLDPPRFRELTMLEAINGIEGLDGLDMTQSPGYPYTTMGISRRSLFEKTIDGWKPKESLERDVERALEHPELFCYVTFLKDELRSLAKIKEANTRVIEGSSLPVIIAMRMVFGHFFAWCHQNNGPILGSAVGCNPDSDWTRYFHALNEKNFCFDVDYKNFDGTVPSIAFDFLADMLQDLCDSNRVKSMINSVKDSIHIWKNEKFLITGAMPSGCVGTSIFNSFINIMVFQSALLENPEYSPEDTYFLTYGDDLLVATDYSIDIASVAAFLHKHTPFQVTPADKNAKEFPVDTTVYDVTFLKRYFVNDPDCPVLIHPLIKPEVYQQSIMWTRGGPFQSMIQSLAELAWHSGPKTYYAWCGTVSAKIKENQGTCKYYFPPYHFLRERWYRNFEA